MRVPGTLTRYRTGGEGIRWRSSLEFDQAGFVYRVRSPLKELTESSDTEDWQPSVIGPAATGNSYRAEDRLFFLADALFDDPRPGWFAKEENAAYSIALAKDGQEHAREHCSAPVMGYCELGTDVPGAEAAYTLTMSGQRQVPYATLSTKVDAKWTFRSRTTADVSVLPLLHVRLHPQDLDELNRGQARHVHLDPDPRREARRSGGRPPAQGGGVVRRRRDVADHPPRLHRWAVVRVGEQPGRG
ncbi:hypothetical protein [Nonomuraea sp. KM88]|uniref:hypothetical protein n=1 Tax=Nonomuraea sp. KM88 TaxID=3457427 RepID=UPI003FCCAA68